MKLLSKSIAAAAMLASASSFAITFDLTSQPNGSKAESFTFESEGLNLTVEAFTAKNGELIGQRDELVGSWDSGLGSTGTNTPAPWHAVDNAGDQFDGLLLSFDKAVSLDSFSIGWWHEDSDASVLAYTGAGAHNLETQTWASLESNDWNHIGTYYDVANYNNGDTAPTTNQVNGLLSKFWFIGARNDAFGTPYINAPYGGPAKDDFFKLDGVSVTAEVSEVPLPAGVWLFMTGLAGFAGFRRKLAAKKA